MTNEAFIDSTVTTLCSACQTLHMLHAFAVSHVPSNDLLWLHQHVEFLWRKSHCAVNVESEAKRPDEKLGHLCSALTGLQEHRFSLIGSPALGSRVLAN